LNEGSATWARDCARCRLLVFITALVSFAVPRVVSGQSTPTWKAPRTPDGQPDLQGVWLSRSATPLERPKALEGRTLLTDAEVAQLQARASSLFKDGNSDFAAGDAVFLAALGTVDRFKSPTSTHNSEDMIEREFDRHTSLIVDPADGRIPASTSDALKRREAAAAAARREHVEDFDSALRCIAYGVPRLGGRYGAGDYGYYQIVQTPGYVLLFMETGHEARIIPLTGRPHASDGMRFWSGDSRGRWEGETLVVETTNFSAKNNFMGSAAGLRLTERFTRVASDAIRYEMTMNDPATWARPWTAEMPLKQSDQRLYEWACHEGNYHIMTGMLSAARSQER
jgi:hypothetical protein